MSRKNSIFDTDQFKVDLFEIILFTHCKMTICNFKLWNTVPCNKFCPELFIKSLHSVFESWSYSFRCLFMQSDKIAAFAVCEWWNFTKSPIVLLVFCAEYPSIRRLCRSDICNASVYIFFDSKGFFHWHGLAEPASGLGHEWVFTSI